MGGFAESLAATSLSKTIQGVDWIIPLLQSIHIITIGVVFVSSLMIALRVMGRMRADEPFAVVWNRFAPWMWSGLVVMLVTGVLLVVGEPVREFTAISFWMKMALLAVAVVATVSLGRVFASAARVETVVFRPGAKVFAGGILVLWLAIIFLGRAIAYDVEVWGSLSSTPSPTHESSP